MKDKAALLSVNNLMVNYGAIQALKGVNLDVYRGEIVAVIGANGKINADERHNGSCPAGRRGSVFRWETAP